MLDIVLFIIFLGYIIFLFWESNNAKRNRRKIKHVIYVNGTRGKSSVTRLIYAGLKYGGYSTFAKTTGTCPMIIDTEGQEHMIKRIGNPNIKEQLKIMEMATDSRADVLVIECMALQPDLQYISQHRMLYADIGVITNVRLDHLDIMGENLDEIAVSLSNTIPKKGILFTADKDYYKYFNNVSRKLDTKSYLSIPNGYEPTFEFDENIALALSVCKELGVKDKVALKGMKNYKRDPYTLTAYKFKNGAHFIGGLSINDPTSTEIVFNKIMKNKLFSEKRLILLISIRQDRSYRTFQHIELAKKLKPSEIWLMGNNSWLISRRIKNKLKSNIVIFRRADNVVLHELNSEELVFAVGNIGEEGRLLMDRVEKEGVELCITEWLY